MILSYLYAKVLRPSRGKTIPNRGIHPISKVNTECIIDPAYSHYNYFGCDCQIASTQIGAFCHISYLIYRGAAEHPIEWRKISPVFEDTRHGEPAKRFLWMELPPSKTTVIRSDAWIGYATIINQGVRIGYGVVVWGMPAKIIKYRFDDEEIQELAHLILIPHVYCYSCCDFDLLLERRAAA